LTCTEIAGEPLKALLLLAAYDLCVSVFGFAGWRRSLKIFQVKHPNSREPTLGPVVQAVSSGCKLYPKNVQCLQRATVLACLLKLEGISCVLVIGAKRFPFGAHAWVELEGDVVLDDPNRVRQYSILERLA
jgi:hypothetical protein